MANDALLLELALAAGHDDYPPVMPRSSPEICNSPSSRNKHASGSWESLMQGSGHVYVVSLLEWCS